MKLKRSALVMAVLAVVIFVAGMAGNTYAFLYGELNADISGTVGYLGGERWENSVPINQPLVPGETYFVSASFQKEDSLSADVRVHVAAVWMLGEDLVALPNNMVESITLSPGLWEQRSDGFFYLSRTLDPAEGLTIDAEVKTSDEMLAVEGVRLCVVFSVESKGIKMDWSDFD